MDSIIELIKDPLHWLGWLLTTGAIILVFHFLNIHLHRVWYHPVILLLVIVIIDVIKHQIKLQ